MFGLFRKKKDFSDFQTPGRNELIKKSRLLVIDDDSNILLKDFLQGQGFSIDHDREGNDISKYISGIYDVIIVDYHGVGSQIGVKQGLDLMRYLNKNARGTRLIAYTSRSLSAAEADFFKLSHAVLQKDLGLTDSMELIEEQLKSSYDKNFIFQDLLKELGVDSEKERNEIKEKIISLLESGNKSELEKYLKTGSKFVANKTIDILIGKLF